MLYSINHQNNISSCITQRRKRVHLYLQSFITSNNFKKLTPIKKIIMYNQVPINHGLATPFLSYRVTLNACKMRDLIWQSYKLGLLRQWSDSQIRCQHALIVPFLICYACTTTSKARVFLGNYNFASSTQYGNAWK